MIAKAIAVKINDTAITTVEITPGRAQRALMDLGRRPEKMGALFPSGFCASSVLAISSVLCCAVNVQVGASGPIPS